MAKTCPVWHIVGREKGLTMTATETASPSKIHLKTVLVPVDFSPCSHQAVKYAKAFAGQFGARVLMTHVVDFSELNQTAMRLGPLDVQRLEDEAREAAEAQLTKLARQEGLADVDFETRVCGGGTTFEVERIAREEEVDLIVLAVHPERVIRHAIVGSTAERIVRHAPCPVLVVREKEHEFVPED